MAGDWIKMRGGLDRDPKVNFIADELADNKEFCSWLGGYTNSDVGSSVSVMPIEVTRDIVIASLLRVWSVALERGKRCKRKKNDLILTECNERIIDSISMVPGFSQAMSSVGWLIHEPDSDRKTVRFPNLLEENTPANEWGIEKKKEQSRRSSDRYRRKNSDAKVTPSDTKGDAGCDAKVTPRREEIRRDKSVKEKEKKETPPDGSERTLPNQEALDSLIDGWNELPDGFGSKVLKRNSESILSGWKAVQKVPELREIFADPQNVLAKIRGSTFLIEWKGFYFSWIFERKKNAWNILKIMDGRYEQNESGNRNRDPARVRPINDSLSLLD